MKKLSILLVLLLSMMSSTAISQEQLWSPPYVYENTKGLIWGSPSFHLHRSEKNTPPLHFFVI